MIVKVTYKCELFSLYTISLDKHHFDSISQKAWQTNLAQISARCMYVSVHVSALERNEIRGYISNVQCCRTEAVSFTKKHGYILRSQQYI